jgi:hypothetical protein
MNPLLILQPLFFAEKFLEEAQEANTEATAIPSTRIKTDFLIVEVFIVKD